jgi:hypothetical protein
MPLNPEDLDDCSAIPRKLSTAVVSDILDELGCREQVIHQRLRSLSRRDLLDRKSLREVYKKYGVL